MDYIPQTEKDISEMLKVIGVQSVDDLFKHIPKRLSSRLNIPEAMDEYSVINHLKNISNLNASSEEYSYFLGGGAYFHYIPSVVPFLLNRSEFHTAYTPYQPEISQGTLQAIFEFQTFMTMLTGMEVSNASMYDGASSTAEAVLMSFRITKKAKVLVSDALNPEYKRVLKTYLSGRGEIITDIKFNKETGITDLNDLKSKMDKETASVVVQYPNFFGCIEELEEIEKIVHSNNVILIVAFTEPFAFGLINPPGKYGADIVSGEVQSFGNPTSFGGPYVGILTTKEKYIRTMPGRIVGETVDHNGKRAYVLTLSAREQHIRREKATSNICSNEGLCALATTIYLSAIGKKGFYELARQNHLKSELTKKYLSKIEKIKIAFNSPTFNEFVITIDNVNIDELLAYLNKNKIIAGLPMKIYYPEMENSLLITTTELNTEREIKNFYEHIEKFLS